MAKQNEKQVEIYAVFLKLNSINTVQGKFEAEVDIVSSWFDNVRGVYDPERHWNPQLVFENLLDNEKKIPTRIEIKRFNDEHSDNVRIVQYQKLIGTFSEILHVKEFPFDTQRIGKNFRRDYFHFDLFSFRGVVVTSLHPISRIKLVGKQEFCYLTQKGVRENENWDFNQTVSIDYSVYQEHTAFLRSQEYPLIRFRALIARKSQFYITNLILPLFFVTSTIFVSFTHDPREVSSRLSACATTLLTSINFRFVIHNYLPNVPYSTYLDIYSMSTIGFITLVFAWHAVSLRNIDHVAYRYVDNFVLMSFGSVYLLGHLVFVVFAWIRPKRRQKIFLQTLPSTENQTIELENLIGYERSFHRSHHS